MLTDKIKKHLNHHAQKNLMRTREMLHHHKGENNFISTKGNYNRNHCINFTSNDYLGLAQHPKIKKAFRQGVAKYGFGSGASNLISGYNQIQYSLERRFAKWLGCDQAILFGSGYLANLGVITALSSRESIILSDKLCHASILDGITLSRAKHYRYQHGSIEHLSQLAKTKKPDLILTESVFSMEGDIAPLKNIIHIANQHNAATIIDEAHSIGIFGKKGGGICEAQQISQKDFACLIAPLGKAFNGIGAIVAGNHQIIDAILQFSRSYHYTTALPPAVVCALHSALTLVIEDAWRRKRLKEIIQFFNQQTKKHNLKVTCHAQTPIKTIIVGANQKVINTQKTLLAKGFYVSAIRPPTVPLNTARLRISLNCHHKENEIRQLIQSIAELTQ